MKTITKGDELMLFVPDGDNSWKSIAYATAHTFTLTGNTVSVASKDHGAYDANEVGSVSWEITSENLYTEDGYDELFDYMVSLEPIEACWAYCKDWDPEGIGENANWTLDTTKAYRKGKVVISSLVVNANHNEKATMSITLTGAGAVEKVAATTDANAQQDGEQ